MKNIEKKLLCIIILQFSLYIISSVDRLTIPESTSEEEEEEIEEEEEEDEDDTFTWQGKKISGPEVNLYGLSVSVCVCDKGLTFGHLFHMSWWFQPNLGHI